MSRRLVLDGHRPLAVETPAFEMDRGELFDDLVLLALELAAFTGDPVDHLGRAVDGVPLLDLFRTSGPQSLGKIVPTNSHELSCSASRRDASAFEILPHHSRVWRRSLRVR